MLRTFLRAKIHRATVTAADLDYVGSVTIDADLMEAAGIDHLEQLDILDVTNGARLTTYALRGEPGSGEVQINGAAAHLVHPGDTVILAAYAQIDRSELATHRARIVLVNESNRIVEVREDGPGGIMNDES
ncbi:MAG TPA: aspartate 1-decarboxylase [Acidobacteria bacterium]|nr:aspartate 1-decarboxylase [Acidobacteriota bacterium]